MSIAWGNVGDAEDYSPGPTQKNRQSPKSNLQVSRLFSQSKLSDFVNLQADGEIFCFPKSILVKRSKKLASMVACKSERRFDSKQPGNNSATVNFPDVDPIILGTYLHLAYCSETNVLNKDTEIMDNPNDLKFLVRLYQFTVRYEDVKLHFWLWRKIIFFAPHIDDSDALERESKLERMKIYKDAFNALDEEDNCQKYMARQFSSNFCNSIPLDDIDRDISLLDDSPDFVRALFLHLAEQHAHFHKSTRSPESNAASTDHEMAWGSDWGVKAASSPAAKKTGDDWNVYQESSSTDMWPATCDESAGTGKAASGQASSCATVTSTNDGWGTGVATPSSSACSNCDESSWLPVRHAKKVSNDGWGPPLTEDHDTAKKVSNSGWGATATEDEDSTWKPSGSGHASSATWGASGSGYAADSW